jgi:tetratricopeptide (TPR) repeat protein
LERQTRDWYLARWLVVRGVCSEALVQNLLRDGGDFVQQLQSAGALDKGLWDLFLSDMESRGSSVTPPSQSTMLRSLRNTAKLPKPGEQFSGFELIEELGRGGMGAVFRVRRLTDRKIFALKLILAGESASDEHRERFRREIEALKRLDHSNIVQVHESSSEGELDYYTMDVIDGGRSLTKAIAEESWGLLAGVQLLTEIAFALDYAHGQGVIHRDVKPSNIVVDGSGKAWLVDFGLVRDLDRATQLTQSGAYLGTPSYMAPEQCVEASTVDGRADVYSLGAVLYKLLVGRKPFESQTITTLMAEILQRVPDLPSSLVKNVDKRLEAVCMKALEKDAGRRYQRAGDFAEDLKRACAGERVHAQAGRRTKALIGTLGFCLVLVIFGLFLGLDTQDSDLLQTQDLEARARGWAPRLRRFEEQLKKPGAFKIVELSRALQLPTKAKFEGGKMPALYRVLLGRFYCLEGELSLRLEDLSQAKHSFEKAKTLLKTSNERKHLFVLEVLLDIEENKRQASELEASLGRVLAMKRGRGDLLLARAKLQFRQKNYPQALFDIDLARVKGFSNKRLRLSILLRLKKTLEAVQFIESDPQWKLTEEDRRAFLHLASNDLNRNHVKKALSRFSRCLEELQPGELRTRCRTVLWAALVKLTSWNNYKSFLKNDVIEDFQDLCQFMDRHFGNEGIPARLGKAIGVIAANLDSLSTNFDRRCFLIYERGCKWAPTDTTLWLGFTNKRIADDIPKEDYIKLIGYRSHCLKIVTDKIEMVQLQYQFQRIYVLAGMARQGLKEIPEPTQEDLARDRSFGADWSYWRGVSYLRLDRVDDAMRQFQRAPRGFGTHVRETANQLGDLMITKGQIEAGLDQYLYGCIDMTRATSINKWQVLVSRICLNGESHPDKITQLLKRMVVNGPGDLLKIVRVWEKLCLKELSEAKALAERFHDWLKEGPRKKIWARFLKEIARLKSGLLLNKSIKIVFEQLVKATQ